MHSSRTRHFGFTLIELLTVIAIIAILIGLLLPALSAAKTAAKKAQAKNDMTLLVTAVKAFNTDYGVYPTTIATDSEFGVVNTSPHNSDIVNVLRADPNNADVLSTGTTPLSVNTRQTIYLDEPFVKDKTNPKGGLGPGTANGEVNTVGVTTAGEWYDPWGMPYIVDIDSNYDGYVQPASGVLEAYTDVNYITLPTGGPALQAGCVAGSFGADQKQGTSVNGTGNKKYQNSDDVLSWQ